MDVEPTYAEDSQFTKLVARHPDVCLVTAALEISRDVNPKVDFDAVFQWIACRADQIRGEIQGATSDWDALQTLGQCMADDHGIYGSIGAYSEPDGSFLDRIIETKRGIPISLSVLYMAVANEAGLPLRDAPAPEHFMTQLETTSGRYFVDPFDHGNIMEDDECMSFLAARTRLPRNVIQRSTRPSNPRKIIIRMLNNLKMLYVRQSEWGAAWKVQHRLSKLQPGSYEERRDLGVVALRSQRPGKAVDILRALVDSAPNSDQELLEGLIQEATSSLVCWN